MRPRKLTPAIEARLNQIARMKHDVPTYKQLSHETGLRPNYLRQLISAKMQELSNKCIVSCETND